MDDAPGPLTYLLIDGENIDATLGSSILGRRPAPEERPRWERVSSFAERRWGNQVRSLFFIAVQNDNLPMPFVQALMALGYTVIPLSGPSDVKVVDVAIERTLGAIADLGADVMLASHDGDFLPAISRLVHDGRRVGLIGFRELTNSGFAELVPAGLEMFDLEDDVEAFTLRLPRMRVIPIESFDPMAFL
jgi:putative heme uptake system protein